MKINGYNIKGVKETVGRYNKLPFSERKFFNIWFDNMTKTVMLIRNDIFFEQCGMDTERYEDQESGLQFLRYDDVSDCINCEYPFLSNANISMAMLRSVLSQYIV